MANFECPGCKHLVDETTKLCPNCDYNIKKYIKEVQKQNKKNGIKSTPGTISLSSVYDNDDNGGMAPQLDFLKNKKPAEPAKIVSPGMPPVNNMASPMGAQGDNPLSHLKPVNPPMNQGMGMPNMAPVNPEPVAMPNLIPVNPPVQAEPTISPAVAAAMKIQAEQSQNSVSPIAPNPIDSAPVSEPVEAPAPTSVPKEKEISPAVAEAMRLAAEQKNVAVKPSRFARQISPTENLRPYVPHDNNIEASVVNVDEPVQTVSPTPIAPPPLGEAKVEPVPEPVVETPAPAFTPVSEPVAETPAPAFTPVPEPVAETPAPAFTPVPEPVAETPAPAFTPVPEPVAETPAPAFTPVPEPVAPTPAPMGLNPMAPTPSPAPMGQPMGLNPMAPTPSPAPMGQPMGLNPMAPTPSPAPMGQPMGLNPMAPTPSLAPMGQPMGLNPMAPTPSPAPMGQNPGVVMTDRNTAIPSPMLTAPQPQYGVGLQGGYNGAMPGGNPMLSGQTFAPQTANRPMAPRPQPVKEKPQYSLNGPIDKDEDKDEQLFDSPFLNKRAQQLADGSAPPLESALAARQGQPSSAAYTAAPGQTAANYATGQPGYRPAFQPFRPQPVKKKYGPQNVAPAISSDDEEKEPSLFDSPALNAMAKRVEQGLPARDLEEEARQQMVAQQNMGNMGPRASAGYAFNPLAQQNTQGYRPQQSMVGSPYASQPGYQQGMQPGYQQMGAAPGGNPMLMGGAMPGQPMTYPGMQQPPYPGAMPQGAPMTYPGATQYPQGNSDNNQ